MTVRSGTMIERRADARVLENRIKGHKAECADCGARIRCPDMAAMRAELAGIREELRTWFDPPAGSLTLFDEEA